MVTGRMYFLKYTCTPIYGLYGVPLNRVWFLPLSMEQGLQISVSCLEQGILFAIPTLEHVRGVYFAARIAVHTNVVAFPARVPLHVHSNTPFQISRSTSCHVFQSGTG